MADIGVDRIDISKGNLIIQNVSLGRLIAMAYSIPDSREYLLAGPDWLATENFDISAKFPLATPDPDVLLMLQRLLGERFDLALHRETRQISGYALLIGKNAPKLRPAASPRPFANFRALPAHSIGRQPIRFFPRSKSNLACGWRRARCRSKSSSLTTRLKRRDRIDRATCAASHAHRRCSEKKRPAISCRSGFGQLFQIALIEKRHTHRDNQ